MHIYGQPAKNPDLDELISRLQEGPSPFDGESPGKAPTVPAQMIGQAQAGFSATTPLGTQNIGACVAVIARDPLTRQTALMHIDRAASDASLAEGLDKLSKGPLDIILLGAHYGPQADVVETERRDSRDNLQKVLSVLSNRDVNIVAADVQSAQSIDEAIAKTNIFVDPVTFAVFKDVPNKADNPDGMLAYAKTMISGGSNEIPLDTVFDEKHSKQRLPVLLREKDAEALNRHVNGRADHEIGDWLKGRGFRDEGDWISTATALMKGWNDRYQKTVAETAQATGRSIDEVRKGPLYLGQNALTANTIQTKQNAAPKAAPKYDLKT